MISSNVYSDVFDEEGNSVNCDFCGGEIVFRDQDSTYMCRECGQIMSRAVFFDYIGAEPPGYNCLRCDSLYPGCTSCPYGYVDEDDE